MPCGAMAKEPKATHAMPKARPVPKAPGGAGRHPAVMNGTSPDAHPRRAFGVWRSALGR
jgi:hypothetical protein